MRSRVMFPLGAVIVLSARAGNAQTFPQQEAEPEARFMMAARGGAMVGGLPVPAFGVGGDIGGMLGRFRFDLGVTYYAPRSAEAEQHPTAGVDVLLLLAHLTGTFLQWQEPVEIGWQLGIDVGGMGGEGFGVLRTERGGSAWVAPRIGVLAAYPVHRMFAVRANLGFSFAGIRPTFQIAGVGDIYEVDGPVGDLSLAAEARF